MFREAVNRHERVKVPMLMVLRDHPRTLVVGTLISLATFVLFYLMTVFALSWGTSALGFAREQFLLIQLVGVMLFGVTIPISACWRSAGGARMLMGSRVAIGVFGLVMAPLFHAGTMGAVLTMVLGVA